MQTITFVTGVLVTVIITVNTQKGPILSKFCKTKYDCGGAFGYMCGLNQTCLCDKFYVLNNYGDKCIGGVGQRCRYDEHCIEGAFCEFQITCQCKENLNPSEDGLVCSKSKQNTSTEAQFFVISLFLFYLLNML